MATEIPKPFLRIYDDSRHEEADLDEQRFERAFETWRSWAQQHAIAETERSLQGGGPVKRRQPGNPALLLLGLAVLSFGIAIAVWEMWR